MQKIKILARRFTARYLNTLVELLYRIKFKFISFDHPPVIILTPGKVGSSSIYKTLKGRLKNPVFHIHRLSKEGIERSVRQHLISDRRSRPLHLIIAKLLREKLKAYDGEIYIITSIREPVSRAISSFFQNTDFYKNDVEKAGLKIDKNKAEQLLIGKLDSGITDKLETWFDKEIKHNFGINVFDKSFDEDEGFRINRNGRYHHLLIKMENLNEKFPKAIQDFLDLEKTIRLQKANVGNKKFYSEAYQTVKNNLKIEADNLNDIITSKYFQHFYKACSDSIKEKWLMKESLEQ